MPRPMFKDFPEITIPQDAIDYGMVDVSWQNDAGPRMIHHSQQKEDNGTATPILTFFCGDDRTKAELGHQYFVGWATYGMIDTADGRPHYEGDDLEAALKFLEGQAAPLAKCMGSVTFDHKPACQGSDVQTVTVREWEGAKWEVVDWCKDCRDQGLFLGWEIQDDA